MLRHLLLFLHLAGVIVWVGGMAFAYFCLRPAAGRVLEPPQRLPLWTAVFALFFKLVRIAVVLILLSGFGMFFMVGFASAPVGWHIMMALGLAMAAVFAYVDWRLYPRLRLHSDAANWPAAAAALNDIRRWVAVNLVLSVCTVAAALFSR